MQQFPGENGIPSTREKASLPAAKAIHHLATNNNFSPITFSPNNNLIFNHNVRGRMENANTFTNSHWGRQGCNHPEITTHNDMGCNSKTRWRNRPVLWGWYGNRELSTQVLPRPHKAACQLGTPADSVSIHLVLSHSYQQQW